MALNGELHPGLSVEVLSHILVQVVTPSVYCPFSTASWIDHVTLASVCKLWRTVLLQCPTFWTCHPMHARQDSPEILTSFLDLSKGAPRSVRHDFTDRTDLLYISQFLLDKPRTWKTSTLGELHLRFGSDGITRASYSAVDALDLLLLEEAPVLGSLIIAYRAMFKAHRLQISHGVFTTPKPALRYLGLHCCTVPWQLLEGQQQQQQQHVFTRGHWDLRTLELDDIQPPVPQGVLFQILRASRWLEHLSWKHSFRVDSPTCNPDSAVGGRVPLPNLRSIELAGSLQDLSGLEQSIVRPMTARAAYELSVPEDLKGQDLPDTPWSSLLGPLLDACGLSHHDQGCTSDSSPVPKTRSFHTIIARLGCPPERLSLYDSFHALRDFETDAFYIGARRTPPPSVRIVGPPALALGKQHHTLSTLLTDPELSGLQVTGVQRLQLYISRSTEPGHSAAVLDVGEWRRVLAEFPNLRVLSLITRSLRCQRRVLAALTVHSALIASNTSATESDSESNDDEGAANDLESTSTTAPSSTEDISVLLPKLETLHLSHLKFNDTWHPNLDDEEPDFSGCPTLDCLSRVIRSRHRAGVPLIEVQLQRCSGLSGGMVDALNAVSDGTVVVGLER